MHANPSPPSPGTDATPRETLHRLARAAGVELDYVDPFGVHRAASDDSLVAILHALGLPIERIDQSADALAFLHERDAPRLVEPVFVAWADAENDPAWGRVPVRAPAGHATQLTTSDGATLTRMIEATPDAGAFVRLPHDLPIGEHELTVEHAGRADRCLVLHAPRRCWAPEGERPWLGLWMPLYAAWSDGRRGGVARSPATFATLADLVAWSGSLGCELLGVLPLLPTFLQGGGVGGALFDPSPYAPISRVFWNELYVDALVAPESRPGDASPDAPIDPADSSRRVDYRGAWRRRWERLVELSERARRDVARREEIERAGEDDPRLERYARFRAATLRAGTGWRSWSESERRAPSFDGAERWAFLYAQHEARAQIEHAATRGGGGGRGLYLDLPVGVARDGFDAWEQPDLFAMDIEVGAPPDGFFAGGQGWGFSPAIPSVQREHGHAWFRDSVRHHMRVAGALRIDHVMGLHRMFWVPPGASPIDGVYVRQAFEELYAILSIESHRWRCRVVGENLGLVPPEVERAMEEHGLLGMSVGQFVFGWHEQDAVPTPGPTDLACLNTHDMTPFAGWWTDADIEQNVALGIFEPEKAEGERAHRGRVRLALCAALGLPADAGAQPVLAGLLVAMASRRPPVLLVTIEDLLGETLAQNMPGVGEAFGSWRRRARDPIERITSDEPIQSLLRSLRATLDSADRSPTDPGAHP